MIRVEINDEEIAARLAAISVSVDDMTPLMQDLSERLVQSTQDRTIRGEQPDGTPFAPRAESTLARYAAEGLSFGNPLHQSKDMISGIHGESGADFVAIGSNAIQAAVMQFGASAGAFGAHIGKDKLGRDHFHSIPWGDIPARPFLGLSEDDNTNIMAELTEWLETAIRAPG